MSITIAVTRNLPQRFSGFLKSCMLEVAPGVYVAPRMKKAVRERVWAVMLEWSELIDDESGVVFFWGSSNAPSGLGIRLLGWPKKELFEHEGMWLTLSELRGTDDLEELVQLSRAVESRPDADDIIPHTS